MRPSKRHREGSTLAVVLKGRQLRVLLLASILACCARPTLPGSAARRAAASTEGGASSSGGRMDASAEDMAPVMVVPELGHEQRSPLAGCVVHAADVQSRVQRTWFAGRRPGPIEESSSCSVNAECIQRHGKTTPGDGFVSLSCRGMLCNCTLEQLVPRASPSSFQIKLDSPCRTRERAEALLMRQCMTRRPMLSPVTRRAGSGTFPR